RKGPRSMSNHRTSARGVPAGDGARPRPPGPEEQRGATATSGSAGRDDQQDIRSMLRGPRFWIPLLVLLAVNWLLVPLFFPQPQDRVSVPYTFFKQQAAAG